jgi:hypothetical protein
MRASCEANLQSDKKSDWLLFYALALFRVGSVDAGKAALPTPMTRSAPDPSNTHILIVLDPSSH